MWTKKVFLILGACLGLFFYFGEIALANIPLEENKIFTATIQVKKDAGSPAESENIEAFLYFYYLTDRLMRGLWGDYSEGEQTVKGVVGTRHCFYLAVLPCDDFKFDPSRIKFTQGDLHQKVDNEDIFRITENFPSKFSSVDTLELLILVPRSVDMSSPFNIYYGDSWTSFPFSVRQGEGQATGGRIERWSPDVIKLKAKEEFKGSICEVNELCISLEVEQGNVVVLGWESVSKVYTSTTWVRKKVLQYAPNKLAGER